MKELEVHVQEKRGEAGIWIEDAQTHEKIYMPDGFWKGFITSLREEHKDDLANRIQAALDASINVRLNMEHLLRCMGRLYSKEECESCQELIRKEIELWGDT
jgi:hypothetical protein